MLKCIVIDNGSRFTSRYFKDFYETQCILSLRRLNPNRLAEDFVDARKGAHVKLVNRLWTTLRINMVYLNPKTVSSAQVFLKRIIWTEFLCFMKMLLFLADFEILEWSNNLA